MKFVPMLLCFFLDFWLNITFSEMSFFLLRKIQPMSSNIFEFFLQPVLWMTQDHFKFISIVCFCSLNYKNYFLRLDLFLFYNWACFALMYICVINACLMPTETKGGIGFSENGIMQDCELPCGCWKANTVACSQCS